MAPSGLTEFAGAWRLERRIDDARAGQVWRAEGRAVLAEDGQGGLIHDEWLTLYLPGQAPVPGARRYLWAAEGDGIAVRFADGRPFHRILLGREESEDCHDCAPDRYVGRYDFHSWPVWTATWDVRGPRKDYRMETLWSPAGR